MQTKKLWTCALLLVQLCVGSAYTQHFAPWSEPVRLDPPVNSPAVEAGAFISKDGLSLYFTSTRSDLGGLGNSDIYVSHRVSVNDPWERPRNLGPTVNTQYDELTPALSHDGHRLYFNTDRPGGFGGSDIYVSRRHDNRDDLGWQAPENLGNGVNTTAHETQPAISEIGITGVIILYFASDRPGGLGRDDIYASTLQPDGTFGRAVPVSELNTTSNDRQPGIRSDGLEMFLGSDRPEGSGGIDLWVSTRASTSVPWSAPVNLGALVNSAANDGRAALSFDGTTIYFQSNRPGGFGAFDLYETTRIKLHARSGVFYFAQAGGGGGVSTTITLINPSNTRAASGTISFFGSDGRPLSGVVSNPVASFQIAPSGTFTTRTDSQASATPGYACISTVDSILAYAGYTIPGLPALVAEPSALNAYVFSAPVSRDLSRGVEVGIAVANISNTTVRVVVSVRDAAGKRIRTVLTSIILGPGEQFSRSLLDLLPALPGKFTGTLQISALSPLPSQSLAVTIVQFGGGSVKTVPLQLLNTRVSSLEEILD